MSDRKVLVAVSRDNGRNWSDWREASLGEVGEWEKTVVFRRFGHARSFLLKIRVTSPIRADLLGAVADVEAGD